ncbi:MAG: hypothetical protein GXP31_14500 [Kiritimatiellaeota bacterium]|nr:hypothetical protein [Kiritimatiellota bacterium]
MALWASVAPPADLRAAVAPADVLGYWRFEPGADYADASGNGWRPVRVGNALRQSPPVAPDPVPATGLPNRGAIRFPGNGALRLPVENSKAPQALPEGQDFTFECWLRTGPRIGVSVIASKVAEDPDAPGTRAFGFDFLTIPGRGGGPGAPLHFRIYTRRDGLIYLIHVPDALYPNRTVHLALTREGTRYRLFMNGRLRGQASSPATIAGKGDWFLGTLGIGSRAFGGHWLPDGARLDEVRICRRALKPNEFLLFSRPGGIMRRFDFGPAAAPITPGWEKAATSPDVHIEGRPHAVTAAARKPIDPNSIPVAATGLEGLTACELRTVPGVYDVRLIFAELAPDVRRVGVRVFDAAVNGRRIARRFDPFGENARPDRPVVKECRGVICPDGRVRIEFLSRTPRPALLCGVELVAAAGTLPAVFETTETGPSTGWEFPLPTSDRLIPEAVRLPAELLHGANPAPPLPYVPSQKFAPFPARLKPRTRDRVQGVTELAPDRQGPLPDGIRFKPGSGGSFEIHHRRAGMRCDGRPVFRLRMEKFPFLATVVPGVRLDGRFVPFSAFAQCRFEVLPGRVRYHLSDDALQLEADLEAVAPVTVPAYGMILRVKLHNRAENTRTVTPAALAVPGKNAPTPPETMKAPGKTAGPASLELRTPQKNLSADSRRPASPPLLLHDTDYRVLIGWNGGNAATVPPMTALHATVRLEADARTTAYLTVFLDSPGYDEVAVNRRLEEYFGRNADLPPDVRRDLIAQALQTFVEIPVQGDRTFARVRPAPEAAFEASGRAWDRGVYRDGPVRFRLPDAKLTALANLVANDLFPGIVQPPGLVHDAKYGDTWNFIFCYRHVHAASDIGFEKQALNYLRLLSENRTENGWIRSVRQNFLSPGHGTRFNASYIDALHHYWKWTGDLEAVRQLWSTCVRAAGYVDASLDPDGDGLYRDVIHQWKSDYDSRGPSSAYQTAIVWRAYRDLAEFADALGKTEDAARYGKKAARIRAAAQRELWSDTEAMFGSKGPLGMLRLHPQSLEVEIPAWTGLLSPDQTAAVTDWYLRNVAFQGPAGGLWMYDNDWWPVVWSQHMGSPGDETMVAWALLLAGNFEAGCRVLETVAAGSFRAASPGFSYTFDRRGVQGGNDPATAQGAFFRCLIEGVFGVSPALDQGVIRVQPRFPTSWQFAEFARPGLDLRWKRTPGGAQTVQVRTRPGVRVEVRLPVHSPVASVSVDGRAVPIRTEPGLGMPWVVVRTPPGGAAVEVRTTGASWAVHAPVAVRPGEVCEIRCDGLDTTRIRDPFGFCDVLEQTPQRVRVRLKRAGAGRAVFFLDCRKGDLEWSETVACRTGAESAKQTRRRTVVDPLPANARFVPLDLAGVYNDDIQRCFRHRWQWDHQDSPGSMIRYWTMPLFRLTQPIPRRVRVGPVPFLLGPMGPGPAEKTNDLVMLANTPPRELPSGVRLRIGRRCRRIYLLSLNMILPQKCYVPAAEVRVRYTDGSTVVTQLIPPLNFDAFFQDFGIDTAALPLPVEPAYGMDRWVTYGGVDLAQHHLTMTDVACDPTRTVETLEVRSIATETFIGLAGVTLAVPSGRDRQ